MIEASPSRMDWRSDKGGRILNDPKRSNRKIAWLLAAVAVIWYVVSMFTIWK